MRPLLVSSNVFLIPAFYSAWCLNWASALLTFNLYLSSLWYHSAHSTPSFVYDQLSILSFWTYTAYLNLSFPIAHAAPFWMITLYLWFIHYYGKLKNRYSFDPVHRDWWHVTIHYSGALGLILTQHALNTV